ncbi:HAD family hydrolase [Gammaproteobacteria bacterium]|nr:HAD family hydrolase [Gammaproteobacteria bacterium]
MPLSKNTNKLKTLVDNKHIFVFDFDGVIANSIEVKTDAFYELYSIYGDEIAKKVKNHHIANGGMSRFDKFRHYHKQFLNIAIGDDELEDLCEAFSEKVKVGVIQSSEVGGSTSFLESLSTAGKICMINSATPQDEIEEIVSERDLSKYFNHVFGSPSSKEKNMRKILQITNCKKDEVIFFGDAKADLEAALYVGIEFIGIGGEIGSIIRKQGHNFPHFSDFFELTNA